MQLAAAGLLAVEAIFSVATAVIFTNHDAVQKALAAQGTPVPQGMSEETYINFVVATAIVFVVFFAVLELVGAAGSYLGWLSAIFNLGTIVRPGPTSPPVALSVVQEVLTLSAAAVFVWMLIGVIRYGPWAMKRPGT